MDQPPWWGSLGGQRVEEQWNRYPEQGSSEAKLHLVLYSSVWGTVVMAKSTASHMGLVKRDGDGWVAAVVTSFLTSICPLYNQKESKEGKM